MQQALNVQGIRQVTESIDQEWAGLYPGMAQCAPSSDQALTDAYPFTPPPIWP